MKNMILLILTFFLASCSPATKVAEIFMPWPPEKELTHDYNVTAGAVIKFEELVSENTELCEIENKEEFQWVTVDSNCRVKIIARYLGESTIRINSKIFGEESKTTTIKIKVSKIPVPDIPPAITPVPTGVLYTMKTFGSSLQYGVTFNSAGKIYTIDFSDPERPQKLGEINYSGGYYQMLQVFGDFLYGVGNNGKRTKYSILDPAHPIEITNFATSVEQQFDVEVTKKYVFSTEAASIPTNSRVVIFDSNNLNSPISSFGLPSYGTGVAISGKYAYLVSYDGKVKILKEKTNIPAKWIDIGNIDLTFTAANHAYADGRYLIIAQYNGNKANILSLENPEVPTLIKEIVLDGVISPYSKPIVQDDILYLGQSAGSGYTSKIVSFKLNKNGVEYLNDVPVMCGLNKDEPCIHIGGIGFVRNGAFISYVGSRQSNASSRDVLTTYIPQEGL